MNLTATTSPLISIIMPAYNAQSFIESAIYSVQSQTYHNWELLIINDHSKDDTTHIIQTLAKKDNRIKLLHNVNGEKGVSSARNLGISHAKGEFIAFLDADDLWLPEKLQEQLNFMQKNQIDFCFTYYQRMSSSRIKQSTITAPDKVSFNQLLFGNPIGCSTVMLNIKNIGKQYFQRDQHHEDYILWLEILKTINYAYVYPKTMTLYRIGENSLSSNKLKAANWQWEVYRKTLGLSLLKSSYYFIHYAKNAYLKYFR